MSPATVGRFLSNAPPGKSCIFLKKKNIHTNFGEGNDDPLQYSCLEESMMEEPGRLKSMGSQRVGLNSVTSLSFFL